MSWKGTTWPVFTKERASRPQFHVSKMSAFNSMDIAAMQTIKVGATLVSFYIKGKVIPLHAT
jgi:hypothetical protein